MMDTILNLGLNDQTVEGLAKQTKDERFAYDAYRRLLTMYGDVVLDIDRQLFEEALGDAKAEAGDPSMPDPKVPAASLRKLVETYKKIIEDRSGKPFPQDVNDQLWGAISAVFRSWMNRRAVTYRRMHGYSDDWGTAVVVQSMVFGNMGDDCATGVAFTRNPSTGEKMIYGEYLANAQGEDVVAGIRTPRHLTAAASDPGREDQSLERTMPGAFEELAKVFQKLEGHFRDLQDVEFTVQHDKVWVLQTRSGKRTAQAAVRVAVDMVQEGILNEEEAVLRVDPAGIDQLLHPRVPDPEELAAEGIHPIASGLPASPGGATGEIVFDADEAETKASEGHAVILVRSETSPEDIHGMKAAKGILTAAGGMTSHAAVVARGMGKPCVVGCSQIHVDYQSAQAVIRTEMGKPLTLKQGDVVTIDGTQGKVYQGQLRVVPAAVSPQFDTYMGWVDRARRMGVRANADTPQAAQVARSFGAEGIGLCRTEHMFFADDRLKAVRCMILARTSEERAKWIAEIEPIQRQDFVGIFKAMDGLPVTVRLLDWPLHEFMPQKEEDFAAVAQALGETTEAIAQRARSLHEMNPMLGHRGVRLGLTHQEIYAAQARAILEAASIVIAEGVDARPEIMLPVVAFAEEIVLLKEVVEKAAEHVRYKTNRKVDFLMGTMIELPRACLVAEEIAQHAQFFSFGTNDLTQTTLGVSRDDAGHFLPAYMGEDLRLLANDPFASLDPKGVGELVQTAFTRGRRGRADLKVGLCGEHGGDPASIDFCETVGLDYVSCSPFRVPIARIASAHATLKRKNG